MICVSIGNGNPAEAKRILKQSGFIELRADLLNWSIDDYREVILAGGRTVFTCRPGAIAESERLQFFEMAAGSGAKYIDIELESSDYFLDSIRNIMAHSDSELIISYHNFELTPAFSSLEKILSDCYIAGADVAKIACRVYSPADAANLLSLYSIRGRKVVLGMGKSGKITRVAAAFLGAEFTFASQGENDSTADGQLSYPEMNDIIKKIQ